MLTITLDSAEHHLLLSCSFLLLGEIFLVPSLPLLLKWKLFPRTLQPKGETNITMQSGISIFLVLEHSLWKTEPPPKRRMLPEYFIGCSLKRCLLLLLKCRAVARMTAYIKDVSTAPSTACTLKSHWMPGTQGTRVPQDSFYPAQLLPPLSVSSWTLGISVLVGFIYSPFALPHLGF